MDKIEAMQIFLRVAELGSFTQAGENLGIPKNTVSTAVSQLENHLGSRLLHRTTRKVQMTQDGQAFYERSKDLLADFDELVSLFQTGTTHVAGRLRVDMASGIARRLVIPHLPAFFAQYPNIEVELSSTDRRVDLVREGFDCVIRIGALTDSGLIARPLGQLNLINCASLAYLQRYGTPQTLDDLSHHHLVHYVTSFGSKSVGWEYFDGEKNSILKMPGILTVNSAESYTAACLAGLGIIQTPQSAVQQYLESGELVEILPRYRPQPMPITLLYPHRRNLPKRVQVFMDWIGQLMRNYVV